MKNLRPLLLTAALALSACAPTPVSTPRERDTARIEARPEYARLLLERVTWGANTSSARALSQAGEARWLEAQLQASPSEPLPPLAQAQIDAMSISQRPVADLATELETQRRAFQSVTNNAQSESAQQAY